MRGHDLFLQRYGDERLAEEVTPMKPVRAARLEWTPLNVKSGFSFMDSLLTPVAAVELALKHGCKAMALTDPNFHGAVDFYTLAKEAGIKPIVAAEILQADRPAVAYVKDATGYRNLCAVLSTPERKILPDQKEGLIIRPAGWLPEIRYGDRTEKPMFEIQQAIRTLSLLDERNPLKRRGDFHFPMQSELVRHRDALRDTLEIAEQCSFEFELGGLRFPRYYPKDGSSAHDFLRKLTMDGIERRYAHRGR